MFQLIWLVHTVFNFNPEKPDLYTWLPYANNVMRKLDPTYGDEYANIGLAEACFRVAFEQLFRTSK